MIEGRSSPLVEGLVYPECPRWHDGSLWFSDQHDGIVATVDRAGSLREVLRVPGRPAGLGWLPDGTLLVVSMDGHALLAADGSDLRRVADLSGLHPGPSNDMVVAANGDAYIGNIGFDYYGGEPARTTVVALVRRGGRLAVVAAGDLLVPNGMVIWPDGKRLVVAESFAHRLTGFDIAADGSLSGRRVFADLGERIPDGICLDADGGVWFASVTDQSVFRVVEGGTLTHRVSTGDRQAYACMLGGPDRRTLFVCTAHADEPAAAIEARSGAIETLDAPAPAPGAGLP
jgi:sugar lactone lactonase YvrE